MNKAVLIFSIILGIAFMGWKWFGRAGRLTLGTPEILGGVIRTDDPAGGRLYYLTSQWEKRVTRIGTSRNSSLKTDSWLNVDLWELDATTAQPLSRRRIKRDKVNADTKALGVDQGVLWARIPELVGIRLADGRIVADSAKIEARNPALAGLVPKPQQGAFFLTEAMQPLRFDPDAGMIVRLDDAREVTVDPVSLEATPYVAPKPGSTPTTTAAENPASVSRMKIISPAHGMAWTAMVRGIAMRQPNGKGVWLGLLAQTEAEELRERHVISYQMDFSVPRRQRLYQAEVAGEFNGTQSELREPTVLPESPEFLMAGLLTQGPGGYGVQSALWRREPDSVFVLSRDRLGDEGRMQLARISGPKGAPVWSIALPLSAMSAWLPGEQHAVMLGPDPSAQRSPMAGENDNPVMQTVSINLKTGELKSFNPDLHRDWPADTSTMKTP